MSSGRLYKQLTMNISFFIDDMIHFADIPPNYQRLDTDFML
jgi:hypothetical protein